MDRWFLFDSVLVANMVVETWVVPIIILSAGADAASVLNISFLRMMRSLAAHVLHRKDNVERRWNQKLSIAVEVAEFKVW